MNKSIVFTAPGVAELLEEAIPAVGPGQVLVKVAVSTISSGTERANLIGEKNISTRVEDCEVAVFPRRAGYSTAGVVEAVGEGVTSLKPGDRVGMSWTLHRQYVVIPEGNAYLLPDDVPFEEAALWHIGTFPMAAIRKCRLEFGEPAIVMGQGVLGKFAIVFLRLAGAAPVIAVDPVEEKRQQALELGADYAFDPNDPDFAKKVKEVTSGGAKVAIEVTGIGKALDQVLDVMAKFGRVALLGCTRHSDFTIDYYHKVHGPGITLVGAHTNARPTQESAAGYWTTRDDVLAEMRLYRLGRLALSKFVEETHSPAEAPEVYHRLATEKSFPLVQFDWRSL